MKVNKILILVLFLITNIGYAKENQKMETPVYEIVKWEAKPNVSDSEMIKAVNNMVNDLKTVDGFLHQSLYKNKKGTWIDIYYWKTEKNAVDSNTNMADKKSLKILLELINLETVTIEIMNPLQSSGGLQFGINNP